MHSRNIHLCKEYDKNETTERTIAQDMIDKTNSCLKNITIVTRKKIAYILYLYLTS